MIPVISLSDIYFCVREFNGSTVNTTIRGIRNSTLQVTLNGGIIPSNQYVKSYIGDTDKLRIRFLVRYEGYLCIFRNSNSSKLSEYGSRKSGSQTERFFDSLVEVLQDESYTRGVEDNAYSLGIDRGEYGFALPDTVSFEYLNREGRRTTLNGRVYKQGSDFNFSFNSYGGSIVSGLPSDGVFGDRRRNYIEINKTDILKQDIETGLSVLGKGYTLVRSIALGTGNGAPISSVVLYRRMLDYKAETYNVQKAMLGTTATSAKIYYGNDTYTCTIEHKYDLIVLNVVSSTFEHNFNEVFTGFATMVIEFDDVAIPLFIENNGITLKEFT